MFLTKYAAECHETANNRSRARTVTRMCTSGNVNVIITTPYAFYCFTYKWNSQFLLRMCNTKIRVPFYGRFHIFYTTSVWGSCNIISSFIYFSTSCGLLGVMSWNMHATDFFHTFAFIVNLFIIQLMGFCLNLSSLCNICSDEIWQLSSDIAQTRWFKSFGWRHSFTNRGIINIK